MKLSFRKRNNLIEELLDINFTKYNSDDTVLYEARNNVTTIENNIINKLESNRRVDLRGLNINNLEDVALLGKICRDTRYETTRFIYVKKGEIVGSDTTTIKLPTASYVTLKFNSSDEGNMIRTFYHINEKAKKLNADGIYMLHNHPSGSINPSVQDKRAIEVLKNYIPLIKDGLIVGHNEIYSIENGNVVDIDDLEIVKDNAIDSQQGVVPENILHKAQKYLKDDDYSILMYVSNKYNILDVDQIKNTEFNDILTMNKYLSNKKKEFGASMLFIYTEDEDVIQNASVFKSFAMNVVTDIIYYDKKSNVFRSLRNENKSLNRSKYNELGKETTFKASVKG